MLTITRSFARNSYRTLSVKNFAVLSAESYTERMDKTGRPVSPHVEIYKFPPTAISSITHRATGCVLAGGIVKRCFVIMFCSLN